MVGLSVPDDAAVYALDDERALVQTVDFFTPIVDDPYDWGRIAAANALSDVYAMGGSPVLALNIVAWPRSLGFEILGRVLEGGRDVCASAGVDVIGGHSIDDPEPKYGLCVTGFVDRDRIITTTGAQPRDLLVLTKALGTGIISSGIKEGVAPPASANSAVSSMTRLNDKASAAMLAAGARAATDVTGFGLIGHLSELLHGELNAVLDAGSIPVLEGAIELAVEGVLPGGSRRNRESWGPRVDAGTVSPGLADVMFDAQTSGGLLIAIDDRNVEMLRERLVLGGDLASVIGRVEPGDGSIRIEG